MRSGFFNSEIIGYDAENMPVFDRAEEASFFAKYFSQFISNGVFPNPSTNMQVLATEGMKVKVDTGVCYINGYMGWVEPFEILEVEESDTRIRIDRVVARLDFTDRSIKLAIKKGVVSGTPVAPELQRDYDIYEIGLADIRVNANVIEIKQENITDLRLNTQLCGIVANHLQHLDTTTLFNQYQDWLNRVTSEAEEGLEEWKQKFETTLQEEKHNFEMTLNNLKNFYTDDFNTWFSNLKVVLSDDVAGNLQLEIENLQDDLNSKYDEINEKIDTLETKKEGHIYGVKRNIESSDPSWERVESSVGLVANATHDRTNVQNDFDSIYPWSDIITYNYDAKSEKITAFIGEPTFKFNGTNGEVMTRIPEFWYKREQKTEVDGNTYEYIYISDYEAEGFIKSEQFSVGRYISSLKEDCIHSMSGCQPAKAMPTDFRTYAKTLGNGLGLMDWHFFIIQLLYLVEYANYNSQLILGEGALDKGLKSSGLCDELGMKSGCLINDSNNFVSYRGIENVFGNARIVIDGIIVGSDGVYVCYDSNQYFDGTLNSSYHKLGINFQNVRTYIKKIGYDENNPLIQIPIEDKGSSSTYMCDRGVIYMQSEGSYAIVCNTVTVNEITTDNGLFSYISHDYRDATISCRLLLNK